MKVELKLITNFICILLLWLCTSLTPANAYETTVYLEDIDSAATIPPGNFRWLDVANQQFGGAWIDIYDYTLADVTVTYEIVAGTLQGTLTAFDLKPNFAYQLKLNGIPGTPSNEDIGLAGRWWQEEWNEISSTWVNGHNLNNKGVGSSPNPNDEIYYARRDIPDPASPTGLRYKFTGYLVFDYFITDEYGDAIVSFEANSSYHVLWKTTQRTRTAADGPEITATFDPDPALPPAYPPPAYDADYEETTVSIFGEWERLPVGGVFPEIGDDFVAQLFLTEESFHGSGGQYAGGWAAAMEADISHSALVIEAEDATIKTIGGPTADGWNLWSEGTLGESVSIPAAGTYEVVVRAYGSPLGGIWPLMELSVDGAAGETVTVDSAVYTDYVFQVDLAPGAHTIGVSFLNDAYDPGVEDRNLYLDRFTIISPPGIAKPEIVAAPAHW